MSTPTPRTYAAKIKSGFAAVPDQFYEFARTLETELTALTAERDQLLAVLVHADQILDDIDTCSDAHKPMYSSYSQNVFKLCVKGRDARRDVIDAALKKGAKSS